MAQETAALADLLPALSPWAELALVSSAFSLPIPNSLNPRDPCASLRHVWGARRGPRAWLPAACRTQGGQAQLLEELAEGRGDLWGLEKTVRKGGHVHSHPGK